MVFNDLVCYLVLGDLLASYVRDMSLHRYPSQEPFKLKQTVPVDTINQTSLQDHEAIEPTHPAVDYTTGILAKGVTLTLLTDT